MVASPKTCAQNAVDRYRKDGLQSLIFESNQGGDMVSTIIHEIDKGVLCEGVRASQSKRARAEPIALMYEQGRIHHVGELPALEDEMCTWVSNSNESPNRIDALVWLATKTLLKQNALASPATEGLTRKSPNIFV
jgi:phage terminase large subunit-like protein